MPSFGFWLLGKREGTLLPSQHTSVPMADPDTQQMQAAPETHHMFTHNRTVPPHFPGQNQGGERQP